MFAWLKNIFNPPLKYSGRTHNYSSLQKSPIYTTSHYDGMILEVINDGMELRYTGWGAGVGIGDHIIVSGKDGEARYLVGKDFYYCGANGPIGRSGNDQWFATLYFPKKEKASEEA
jgi:hypothetical protein